MLANCLDFPTEGRSVLALLAADFNQLSATKHYASHMKSCLQYKVKLNAPAPSLPAANRAGATSRPRISPLLSRWASDYTAGTAARTNAKGGSESNT